VTIVGPFVVDGTYILAETITLRHPIMRVALRSAGQVRYVAQRCWIGR
jgi:hypothetical protein